MNRSCKPFNRALGWYERYLYRNLASIDLERSKLCRLYGWLLLNYDYGEFTPRIRCRWEYLGLLWWEMDGYSSHEEVVERLTKETGQSPDGDMEYQPPIRWGNLVD